MKLSIIKQAHFSHPRGIENKELRQLVKDNFDVAVRRMDNFTLAGLAAVAKLELKVLVPEKISLISCAPYFSVELVQKLILDGHSGKSIRPLDFVSTVGNAANFYIAKQFDIHGSNLFLGADKHALKKALLVSAIELLPNPKQQAVVLLWQETQTERSCQALLVKAVEELPEPEIQTLSFDALLQTKQPSPFILNLGDPATEF